MVERDIIYELDVKVKHEARRRRAESDAVLESVYEMIVSCNKEKTAVYTMEEEPYD